MTSAERIVLGSAIEEAAGLLPDGWQIEVVIERGSATALLYDDGRPVDYPTSHESLADEIRDAIEHSQSEAMRGI